MMRMESPVKGLLSYFMKSLGIISHFYATITMCAIKAFILCTNPGMMLVCGEKSKKDGRVCFMKCLANWNTWKN